MVPPTALAEQETYALNDVLHLGDLRARLLEELDAKGRVGWVEEECAALAASSPPEKVVDPDAYLRLKGAKDLDPRGSGVLRELYQMREAMALRLDRPPFMIVGNESLVALAAKRPKSADEILAVPGCSQSVVRRAGAAILEAVARGESLGADALPVRRLAPRPAISAVVRRRADALRAWRPKAAQEIGLDPGVLLPQRVIDRLAADPPRDLVGLEQVEGRWRVDADLRPTFGGALGRAGGLSAAHRACPLNGVPLTFRITREPSVQAGQEGHARRPEAAARLHFVCAECTSADGLRPTRRGP